MTHRLIDGRAFAERVRRQVAETVADLKSAYDFVPGLAVVLVGNDPASQVYVRNKEKQTVETGMHSERHDLPADAGQDRLLALVQQLNRDPDIHGILVQLPLPSQMNADAVIDAIDPAKDVDGFHAVNTGRLWTGTGGLVPCTPLGCMMMIRDVLGADLSGKRATIVGRSNIVGKPMAALLLAANATVTVAHSRTKDLAAICREADILVAAIGRPQMIKGNWIKPGAVVLDVGINRVEIDGGPDGKAGRLVGDVDFDAARGVAGAITPVPGGVGPMTIACLLANTVIAACRIRGVPLPSAFA